MRKDEKMRPIHATVREDGEEAAKHTLRQEVPFSFSMF